MKEALEASFITIHSYAGTSVGEVLGYLTLGIWLVLLGLVFTKTDLIPKWLSFTIVINGMLYPFGILEFFGIEIVGLITTIISTTAIFFLLLSGVFMLLHSNDKQ
jgi:hypothetical protein